VPSRRRALHYIIGTLQAGGSERQLYYLLRTLDRYRYEPHVIVWSFRESDPYVAKLRDLSVPIHSLAPRSARLWKLRNLRSLVTQMKPHVVHSYSFFTNFAAFCATVGSPAVPIGSVRSNFKCAKLDAGPLMSLLNSRWPRTQIYNSWSAAASARTARGFFLPRNVFVVTNGLDLESFRPSPSNANNSILAVGSLSAVKRWDRLISAAVTLKNRGLQFSVRILGDGPLRETLLQQANAKGVGDSVHFLGHTDDVASFMSQASFPVHTADHEGCPNVIMEAMACGRAVVATDAGDIPRLIDNATNGFLVERGKDDTLAERMATLLSQHDLCARMGEAGRARAQSEFGLERLVANTLAAYRQAGCKLD